MAELRSKDGQVVVPTVIPPETKFEVPAAVDSSGQQLAHTRSNIEMEDLVENKTSNDKLRHQSEPLLQSKDDDQVKTEQDEKILTEPIKETSEQETKRPNLPFSHTEGLLNLPNGRSRVPLNRSATSGIRASRYNNAPDHYPYGFKAEESSDSDSSDSDQGKDATNRNDSTSAGKAASSFNAQRRAEKRKGRNGDKAYSRFDVGNDKFTTKGKVDKNDGRLNLSINETANSGYLAKALGATLKGHFLSGHADGLSPMARPKVQHSETNENLMQNSSTRPRLNIVIIVIGSRGDIQPFVKIGKILKNDYGHRVRLATHPTFKEFVEKDAGLEFFSVGGDPSELMAFMVKNPGLIPSLDTVRAGEIGKRRASMYEMFQGMWRACINATDDETDRKNLKMMGLKDPFIADAIIANPPSFAHVHIAEALGVPLHMMFTFPYTPTTAFPHPLANIKQSNVDRAYTNFMSYPLVELMTWQGLGDLVNKFRVKTLGLEPVSTLWAPGQLYRFNVPYTYLWSPSLVPKPEDWGPEIEIAGFVFLELASSFKPPKELSEFLDAGEPPIYIGFGSIVVDDPEKFTNMIFEAVKMAGVRALVSKGWGGIGGEGLDVPENIFLLENTPHDWLFPKVKAVVHHGGAGTTAIGLKCAKPTMIVPFFGDQPFWGAMVAEKRAGAFECIPYKKLTAEKLAEGIKQCLTEEAQENVQKIADGIEEEGNGALNAVKSFHRSLPLTGPNSMRCSILENRVAVWQLRNARIRFSALAAEILVEQKKLKWSDLRLMRHLEWNDFGGAGEPISGIGTAVFGSLAEAGKGLGRLPVGATKIIKRRAHHNEKKKKLEKRRARAQVNAVADTAASREKTEHGTTTAKSDPTGASADNSAESSLQRDVSRTVEGNLETGTAGTARPPELTNSKDSSSVQGPDAKESDSKEPEAEKANGSARPTDRLTHQSTQFTQMSALSDEPQENLAEALAIDAGDNLSHSGLALLKLPLDLILALAQGFHNAPRLYGDSSVRVPRRINGFHSGLRAAGDEFVYGIYDGVTGLVRLPVQGAREDGILGGLKGVSMGIGGFVLKDIAAFIGPPAYAIKGIEKEMMKRHTPTAYLRKGRIMQGAKEIRELREDRQEKIESLKQSRRQRLKARMTSKHQVPLSSTKNLGDATPSSANDSNNDVSKQKTNPSADSDVTIRQKFGEPLSALVERTDHGWAIAETGLAYVAHKRSQGPFGKIAMKMEGNRMNEAGELENVGTIEQKLEQVGWRKKIGHSHGHLHGLGHNHSRKRRNGEADEEKNISTKEMNGSAETETKTKDPPLSSPSPPVPNGHIQIGSNQPVNGIGRKTSEPTVNGNGHPINGMEQSRPLDHQTTASSLTQSVS